MTSIYNGPVPKHELKIAEASLLNPVPQTGGDFCFLKYLFNDPLWRHNTDYKYSETKFIFILLVLESEEYHG